VSANSSGTRTFDLEIPRGTATVRCGKYFEVRYFLNVIVGTPTKPKLVTVQLPLILIHLNSLDVIPNSAAQVHVAFEEQRLQGRLLSTKSLKQVRSRSIHSLQGQTFAAPRKYNQEDYRDDLSEIGRGLEASPRRFKVDRSRQQRGTPKLPPTHHHNDISTMTHQPTEREITYPFATSAKQYDCSKPLSPPRFKLSGLAQQHNPAQQRAHALPSQSSLTSFGHRPTTIEEARERLRKLQSSAMSQSNNTITTPRPIPIDYTRDNRLHISQSQRDYALSLGNTNASLMSGNLPSIARPFRKMKSTDRWKLPANWFERNRDRDVQKGLSSWI
jgi:hypothetical protein